MSELQGKAGACPQGEELWEPGAEQKSEIRASRLTHVGVQEKQSEGVKQTMAQRDPHGNCTSEAVPRADPTLLRIPLSVIPPSIVTVPEPWLVA